jgi:hypothetical protein
MSFPSASEIAELSSELNKPVKKNFERRSVRALAPDELWSADLVDMSRIKNKNKNKKITFLLNIVDVYSRYAYSFPLKHKTGAEVLKAFESIKRTPKYLWVDEGSEFYNSDVKAWCKKHGVVMYSTHSGLKSVFVERFNRTMKEAFNKRFYARLTTNYHNFLPAFIKEYNDTVHSSTKETPDNLYNRQMDSKETTKEKKPDELKYDIGDYVRISKVKRTFEKGYTERYSHEAYKIRNIDDRTTPILYELEDLKGESIDGKFYAQELLKTKIPFVKLIDKIVKQKTENKKKYYLVSYVGWDKKFDEFISEADYKKWLKFKKELDD